MSTRMERSANRSERALSATPDDKPARTSWINGRPWTTKETEDLVERASTQTIPTIAKQIGRSEFAVRHKLKSLGVDYHDLAGFKAKDIAGMLQVTVRQVRRWRRKGYLRSVNGRITEESFTRFCKIHADKIPYNRLDEGARLWLRGYGYEHDAEKRHPQKRAAAMSSDCAEESVSDGSHAGTDAF